MRSPSVSMMAEQDDVVSSCDVIAKGPFAAATQSSNRLQLRSVSTLVRIKVARDLVYCSVLLHVAAMSA